MKRFVPILALLSLTCLGARKFNGTNYYNQARVVTSAAPLTLSTWVFLFNTNNSQALITVNSSSGDRFGLSVSASGKVNAIAAQGSTNGTATSAAVTTTNAWHHVAGVFNSTSSRILYLDGVPVATNTTVSVPQSIDRFLVGARLSTVVETNFFGELAECAVWSTNLNAADILLLSAGFKPQFIQFAWLRGYDQMISDSTSKEVDLMSAVALMPTNAPAHTARHPIVR